MNTNSVSNAYQKSAQIALFRNVYLWMSMALVITGLTAPFLRITDRRGSTRLVHVSTDQHFVVHDSYDHLHHLFHP